DPLVLYRYHSKYGITRIHILARWGHVVGIFRPVSRLCCAGDFGWGFKRTLAWSLQRFVFCSHRTSAGLDKMSSVLEKNKGKLAEVCRRFGVRRLEVFGSAVREDFDPAKSDFDFIVSFADKTPGTYADRY